MGHNLEYLLTRPGILKLGTIVLGLITFSLGVSSYTNSSYTEFYSNATSNGNPKNLPGTELELYHLSSAGIYLGISVGYLVLYAFIYELCESRLNRIMDTFIHMTGALFLFAGGCVLFYSTAEIENEGCDEFYALALKSGKTAFRKQGILPTNRDCQHFGEKIVAGVFSLVNGILYCITGITAFVTKDL